LAPKTCKSFWGFFGPSFSWMIPYCTGFQVGASKIAMKSLKGKPTLQVASSPTKEVNRKETPTAQKAERLQRESPLLRALRFCG